MMNGIITFTVTTEVNTAESISRLDDEVATLGFGTTLTETETGSLLNLPSGTYACIIEIDDRMEQMKHYYRELVKTMRGLEIKGKYFINLAANPAYICGEL